METKRTKRRRTHHGAILREGTRLCESGRLTPLLDPRAFTWVTVDSAFDAIRNGSAAGKIVVGPHA